MGVWFMQAKNQPSSMKIGDFRILSFSVRYQTLILGFKSLKYQNLTYWGWQVWYAISEKPNYFYLAYQEGGNGHQ